MFPWTQIWDPLSIIFSYRKEGISVRNQANLEKIVIFPFITARRGRFKNDTFIAQVYIGIRHLLVSYFHRYFLNNLRNNMAFAFFNCNFYQKPTSTTRGRMLRSCRYEFDVYFPGSATPTTRSQYW